MITKITLDMLTETSVSVKTQMYVEVDGIMHTVGLQHRKAYVNSDRGRREISAELPEPHLSAVMAMWGDSPTVFEDNEDGGV